MPIKIPRDLPAYSQLEAENIFVMDEKRALSQDPLLPKALSSLGFDCKHRESKHPSWVFFFSLP